MSSTDILQDVHDRAQMPKVNKIRLSIAHVMASVCVGYIGYMISAILTAPLYDRLDEALKNKSDINELAPILDQLNYSNIFFQLSGPVFIIIGGIISFIICRKQKVKSIVPVSIFLYSEIVYWLCEKTQLCGFLFPGGYLRNITDLNIAPHVNLIYVLIIAWFLFFSKRVKNWWLRPVIE
jgi:hypothetical protein